MKDWEILYNDQYHPDVANTLTEAKKSGTKYYRHECAKHGKTVFRTLDNTCPHCARENTNKRRHEQRDFNRAREVIHEAKYRARTKHIPFDLTAEYVRNNTPNKCPVLGTTLTFEPINIPYNRNFSSPSLDRLDPSEGYTVSNTRIISWRANQIRNDGTYDEHLRVAIWEMFERGFHYEDILTKTNEIVDDLIGA